MAKNTLETTKPKAYGRRVKDIPQEYRIPEIDYNKHADDIIYVDANGKPIEGNPRETHDVSNVTWYVPQTKSAIYENNEQQITKAEQKRVERISKEEQINKDIKDNSRTLADFTPVLGDVLQAKDAYNALRSGNRQEAGILLASLLVPNVIEKPIKGAIKSLKRLGKHINNFEPTILEIRKQAAKQDIPFKQAKVYEQISKDPKYNIPTKTKEELQNDVTEKLSQYNKLNKQLYEDNLSASQLEEFKRLQSLEDNDMFRNHPAYTYFAVSNGLNPYSQQTADAFIKLQSTSKRGVFTKSADEPYLEYLTHADSKHNPKRRGADQFDSKGLYTSNSDKIMGKFDKAVHDAQTTGYRATLYHDYNIDKSKPIKEQLQQLQDRNFEYEVLSELEREKKYTLANIDEFRMSHPDIHAWESMYFGYPAKQRAYLNTTNEPSKSVADIISLESSKNNGVRQDRFAANNTHTQELFIPQYPNATEHNIQRYTDLLYPHQKKGLTREGSHAYSKKYYDIELDTYKHFNELDRLYQIHKLRQLDRQLTLSNIKYNNNFLFNSSLATGGLTGMAIGGTSMYNKIKHNKEKKDKDKNK